MVTTLVGGLVVASCAHQENAPAGAETWSSLQSQHPGGFIYKADTESPVAALTFDDGPSELSGKLLDLLSERGVKATFFWQGNNLARFPNILRRAIAEGHTVGQHSWDHSHVSNMDPELLWFTQIEATNREFEQLANHEVIYYRPPFGEINANQTNFLTRRRIMSVGWSITSLDWDDDRNSPDQVVSRVLSELHPGALVLLHDYPRGENEQAFLTAIARIIVAGEQRGFTWVNLHTLLQDYSAGKLGK